MTDEIKTLSQKLGMPIPKNWVALGKTYPKIGLPTPENWEGLGYFKGVPFPKNGKTLLTKGYQSSAQSQQSKLQS